MVESFIQKLLNKKQRQISRNLNARILNASILGGQLGLLKGVATPYKKW